MNVAVVGCRCSTPLAVDDKSDCVACLPSWAIHDGLNQLGAIWTFVFFTPLPFTGAPCNVVFCLWPIGKVVVNE